MTTLSVRFYPLARHSSAIPERRQSRTLATSSTERITQSALIITVGEVF
jgi:hypothetical protein